MADIYVAGSGQIANLLIASDASATAAAASAVAAAASAAAAASTLLTELIVSVPGQPASGELVASFVVANPFELPANLGTAIAGAGTLPTANSVWLVKRNGVQIGTVTIEPDGDVALATTGGLAIAYVREDLFGFYAPVSVDLTLSDPTFTLIRDFTP